MKDIVRTGKPARATARAGAPPPKTGKSADSIAVGLQQLFAAVAEEPVPDEFLALLDRIEAAERAGDAGEPPATEGGAKR